MKNNEFFIGSPRIYIYAVINERKRPGIRNSFPLTFLKYLINRSRSSWHRKSITVIICGTKGNNSSGTYEERETIRSNGKKYKLRPSKRGTIGLKVHNFSAVKREVDGALGEGLVSSAV